MSLFKLSRELIIIILEELDPNSLLCFCKTSRYIKDIVTNYSMLLYRRELALSGLMDGSSISHLPCARLDPLLRHRSGWLSLNWTSEDKLRIPTPTIVGVSGRFLYHASESSHNGLFQWSLHIYELRSYRAPPVDKLRYCRFNLPFEIRQVAIDPLQNLLVLAELHFPPQNGPILACLHFLDMWTCQQHPHAANMRFQFQTDWWGTLPSGHRISVERVQIHGKTVGVSVRLEVEGGEGTTELVLVNWRTGRDQQQRFTGDLLSFDILSEPCLVVLSHPDEDDDDDSGESAASAWERSSDALYLQERGKRSPQITIHHIPDGRRLRSPQVISYDLPKSWRAISFLQLCPNSSLKPNVSPPAGTFFYSDPSQRATVILVEFPSHSIPPGCSRKMALVTKESFFEPPSLGDKTLSWEEWQDHCLLVHLPDEAHTFKVVGRKLVFLQSLREQNCVADARSRLHVLDFNDYAAECLRCLSPRSSTRSWNGKWGTASQILRLGASEFVRTSTTQVQDITWIDATEDAIVLYNEHEGQTIIRVLTFGGLSGIS
ncbi:hypothetical protein M405DRAFT_864367 [Rhizopogon salebrosus TDB-379]|nr:hypothetical protein M405DRAFT_864367 [Rhizopogon salebrosus TDB-379]